MVNYMTKSQIEKLKDETRHCFACTLPKVRHGLVYVAPLFKWDAYVTGRSIEIGKRGGIYREQSVNRGGYYGV